MVVIGIIGVLAAFLIPNIQDAMSNATVAAEQGNMREVYNWMTMYKNNNKQAWPTESGQKFLLKLWKSGTIERSEKNAKRFFSAGENYTEYLATMGLSPDDMDVTEYLTDWDAIGPAYINYAAFDPQGDPSLRRKLKTSPGSVTILANATFAHRNAIVYMMGTIPVGLGSPIEELQTVTND